MANSASTPDETGAAISTAARTASAARVAGFVATERGANSSEAGGALVADTLEADNRSTPHRDTLHDIANFDHARPAPRFVAQFSRDEISDIKSAVSEHVKADNGAAWYQGSGKTFRTMCVRLCDGAYFPVSFSTTPEQFARDEAACHSRCGAPSKLFVLQNPGGSPESMTDLDGRSYIAMPTAFAFRHTKSPSCSCRAEAWETASKNRHLRRTGKAKAAVDQPARDAIAESAARGSPDDIAARGAAAIKVMQSQEWQAAVSMDPARDTSLTPGYMTPEWKAARVYTAPSGDVVGFDKAAQYLLQRARSAVDGGVRSEKKVFVLLGMGGSGKSTIAKSISTAHGAMHIVADDAKLIIPEYDGGRNSAEVHNESADLVSTMMVEAVSAGNNIIIEKIGSSDKSIQKIITASRAAGYSVRLVHVDTPVEIAMERAVKRWRATGRAVPMETYAGLDISGVFARLREQEDVDEAARVRWEEATGVWINEGSGADLGGLQFGSRAAAVQRGVVRVDRGEGDRRGIQEGDAGRVNPALSISPDVRIARAIELREAATGGTINAVVSDYAYQIEAARGDLAATKALVDAVSADKLSYYALEEASRAGRPVDTAALVRLRAAAVKASRRAPLIVASATQEMAGAAAPDVDGMRAITPDAPVVKSVRRPDATARLAAIEPVNVVLPPAVVLPSRRPAALNRVGDDAPSQSISAVEDRDLSPVQIRRNAAARRAQRVQAVTLRGPDTAGTGAAGTGLRTGNARIWGIGPNAFSAPTGGSVRDVFARNFY
ncbi:MAG: DUF2865 domain-containing protein [Hyphomicrobiaceae bacterium]|nr:DUF2865 domain-containing protein [Hyphomicrobiaceae bacterium]